ncbi:hypothetical protein [uncultured Tateyamaria sp.]|uniref:hypothetical protein n=1 Tax=uncultured Tateyamaria sp. TaxID=455651 RepID=UPI002619232A|nr:hypothetical protein [uncultured Tateyamaria sp.]
MKQRYCNPATAFELVAGQEGLEKLHAVMRQAFECQHLFRHLADTLTAMSSSNFRGPNPTTAED